MRFLVTNDDGIDSIFLRDLAEALLAAGNEIFIVAPRSEQSWIGAAKSRNRPVHSSPVEKGFGCPTWVVDGTPSDCVNIALAHLLPVPPGGTPPEGLDGVISGINIGLNASLGFIIASGTIAGAWEGALHGLPAVAFSQDVTVDAYDRLKTAGGVPDAELRSTLRQSAAQAATIGTALVAQTPLRSFILHNVNFPFPCRRDSQIRRTVPARMLIPGLFSPQSDDGTHRMIFKVGTDVSPSEPLTDRAALAAGLISHTLLDYTRLGIPNP